jgi:hypothetical protein
VAAGPFPAGDEQWKLALRETQLFGPLSQAELAQRYRTGIFWTRTRKEGLGSRVPRASCR